MSVNPHNIEHQSNKYWNLPSKLRAKLNEHPIGKNLYITEIAFYTDQSSLIKEVQKNNLDFVLLYCMNGAGWYKFNNKKNNLNNNQFVLLPPRHILQFGTDYQHPCSLYFIKFNGTLGEEMYNYLFPEKTLLYKSTPPLVGRIAQFRDILHHLDLMDNMENLLYANFRFYSFLGTFRLTVFNYMKKGTDNIIERSILVMKQHLNGDLSLEDLAREVCVSASYLSSLFRQKTHYSPIQLYNSLKIQKASQLLKVTQTPIKQIAIELGYTDQYSFSRSFKQVMGTSPKKFRESNSF